MCRENNNLSIRYLIDADPRGSMGLGGVQGGGGVTPGNFVTAIDPKTAKVAWRHPLTGGGGNGHVDDRWPAGLRRRRRRQPRRLRRGNRQRHCGTPGSATSPNAPQTYMLDGKQYVLASAGDALVAFVLH